MLASQQPCGTSLPYSGLGVAYMTSHMHAHTHTPHTHHTHTPHTHTPHTHTHTHTARYGLSGRCDAKSFPGTKYDKGL